jgi:hypothetical protein
VKSLSFPALSLLSLLCLGVQAFSAPPPIDAGPLLSRYDLTLTPGQRTEALGPLYYSQQAGPERTWAVPPLFAHTSDPELESEEFDFLYPLMSYDRFGDQYRWHFFQLFSYASGPTQDENIRNRLTLFPIYFRQRSSDPAENYIAVMPFYGHLKNRLFREEVRFVMLPFYVQSKTRGVVTDNYVYPFFHLRHGQALSGWQLWPLVGHEQKDVTIRTNRFDQVEIFGGHDRRFVLWPFYYNERNGLGTDNPERNFGVFPFYTAQRSTLRDATTVGWPLFSWIDDREKKYREQQLLWPLVVIDHGEGKRGGRVAPFFGRTHSPYQDNEFYLWPIYKYSRVHSDPLDRRRTRIVYFLYSDTREKNTETGASRRRQDLWPLFWRRQDLDGTRRFQVLAPLEPFVPTSKSIERDWSPVWALWRAEANPKTGAASQSLLWNLYRRDVTPATTRASALFGLFQYQSGPGGRQLRLFYVPLSKRTEPGGAKK